MRELGVLEQLRRLSKAIISMVEVLGFQNIAFGARVQTFSQLGILLQKLTETRIIVNACSVVGC